MHRALCAARRTHVEHNTDSSLSITHPVSQASVPVLLQLAQNMFPEGTGAPKLTFKIDKAAAMTNELFVNARDAVRKLWEARGYDPYNPEITKQRLGYALDKEEALAYLVCDVVLGTCIPYVHARMIGDRFGKLVFGPAAYLPKERYAPCAYDKRTHSRHRDRIVYVYGV